MKHSVAMLALIICTHGGIETLRATVPDEAPIWRTGIPQPGDQTMRSGLWATGTPIFPVAGAGVGPEMLVPISYTDHSLALVIVDPRDCIVQ